MPLDALITRLGEYGPAAFLLTTGPGDPRPHVSHVAVTWDDGGIVVLNQMLPSPVAVERFKPVLDRAFKARGNTQESIVDQIALLAMFQDSGLLSQDEFDSAAARALHKDRTE